MSTIKRKIRYILSADVSSFNINTKSLILIYKEIYKYVFLKIYRQAYFSTLLNMHLLLYIDTHTHTLQKEAFVPTCCLPACTSCFILGKEWHFSLFAPYPFCFRYTLLLYSISTHSQLQSVICVGLTVDLTDVTGRFVSKN